VGALVLCAQVSQCMTSVFSSAKERLISDAALERVVKRVDKDCSFWT
jgi:hypothetical protein